MMNPELKARWVAALRSGKFNQGKCYLSKGGQSCCLGVLEIITKDELGTKVTKSATGATLFDGNFGAPSRKHLIHFFGSDVIPSVVIDGNSKELWVHNDNGETFDTIAKAIEEQL